MRAKEQRLEEGVERIGVEERERRHENIALLHAEPDRGDDAPPLTLRGRTDDTLRRARGAGGIENRERIARPELRRRQWVGRPGYPSSGEAVNLARRGVADEPYNFKRCFGNSCVIERRQVLRLEDQELGARILQNMGELRASRPRIDR